MAPEPATPAAVLDQLLTRGIRVGIGSNYDARLRSVLDGFPELAPLRERVVISAAVGYRKPALEFFREVSARRGLRAGRDAVRWRRPRERLRGCKARRD